MRVKTKATTQFISGSCRVYDFEMISIWIVETLVSILLKTYRGIGDNSIPKRFRGFSMR